MNWRTNWIRNKRVLNIILITAVFATTVRLLISLELANSALLYLAIPYSIALVLAFFRRRQPTDSIVKKYMFLIVDSLIIMLASSLVLFEGFICVLMFMPIYFVVVLMAFAFESLAFRLSMRSDKSKLNAQFLPLLLLIFSLEGVSTDLSFPRSNKVSVSKIVSKTPQEVQQNLLQPMHLETSRHWFLSIFPMPYQVDAGSLKPGDVHTIHYRYKRWFFTNIHEGVLKLSIELVSPNRIETRILEDTSYLSNYMALKGTEITLQALANGTTKITLSADYDRKLDPAWYFQPLQEYGVTKMAEFLIDELMNKGDS